MTIRIGTRIQAISLTALVGMAALVALASWDFPAPSRMPAS